MFRLLVVIFLLLLNTACGGGSGASFDNEGARLLEAIEVAPVESTIPQGESLTYSATGVYSDGSSEDISGIVIWSTADASIAAVDESGNARALAQGTTQIIAQMADITGFADLTVVMDTTPPEVEDLRIFPPLAVIPLGGTQDYRATAFFDDGSQQDVTFAGSWSMATSPPILEAYNPAPSNSAALDSIGTAIAIATGSDSLLFDYQGLQIAAEVQVTDAVLQSIAISPRNERIAVGTTTAFTAEGSYSDDSRRDITDAVTWSSSDSAVASISNEATERGLASANAIGDTQVSASLDGLTDSTGLRVDSDPLLRIDVTPAMAKVSLGGKQLFTAMAVFASGDAQDLGADANWSSSNASIASIDDVGLASSRSAGDVEIRAEYAGSTGVARLSVLQGRELVSISVAPAASELLPLQTIQFTAQANYSDGTVQDVSSVVVWRSNNTNSAAISNSERFGIGLALAQRPGESQISAQLPGQPNVVGTAVITVLPFPGGIDKMEVNPITAIIVEGESLSYEGLLVLNSGSKLVVTNLVSWSSDNIDVAVMQAGGVAFGEAAGAATITARLAQTSFSASAALTVVADTRIERIVVTPALATVIVNESRAYTATAQLSNGGDIDVTTDVDWTTADGAVANITSGGLATGLAPGTSEVQGVLDTGEVRLTGTASINVTPATITGIVVSPATATIGPGENQQYRASAQLSDGSTIDVSNTANWQTGDTGIAQIAPGGLAFGRSAGETQVTATVADAGSTYQGSGQLLVTGVAVERIQVRPRDAETLAGSSVAFTASAILSDATERDITGDASWFTTDEAIAAISSGESAGLASGLSAGATTVYIEYRDGLVNIPCLGEISCEASLTVEDPITAVQLDIDPQSAEVLIGNTVRYRAKLLLSDNTVLDVSEGVSWSSVDASVAALQTPLGEFIGLAEGSTAITASGSYAGSPLTASATLYVTPPAITVDRLEVVPAVAQVFVGDSGRFEAFAYLSNGDVADVTLNSSWASTDVTVGVVEPDNGFGRALSTGETEVSATLIYNGASSVGRSAVTVSEALPDLLEVSPSNAAIAAGDTLQYIATLYYEDGRNESVTDSVNWSSSDEDISTISNVDGSRGEVQTLGEGVVEITAAHASGLTSSAQLTVIAPVLVSLEVLPDETDLIEGASGRLNAVATFSDESVLDVTANASWSSNAAEIVSVENGQLRGGRITAYSVGNATVNAAYKDVSATSVVAVQNNSLVTGWIEPSSNTLEAGSEQDYRAFAEFLDGSIVEVTNDAVWQTSDSSVATVGNGNNKLSLQPKGRVLAIASGTADITATFDEVTVDSSPITVTQITTVALRLDPESAALFSGETVALYATAEYSDGDATDVTASSIWSSSDTSVATVSNAVGDQGIVTGMTPGSAVITAQFDGLTATAAVTVEFGGCQGKPTSIVIDSGDQVVQEGHSARYTARATYANGCAEDITDSNQTVWQSQDKKICRFDSPKGGIATGIREGVATVEVKHRSLTATALCTVTPREDDCDLDQNELPDFIYIVDEKTIAIGEQDQFEARAVWRGGACETDVTTSPFLQWRTLNGGEQICSIVPQSGIATGKREGISDVEAAYNGGRNDQATCTVPPNGAPGLCGPEWEVIGASYNIGDEVSFEGERYRCIQAHITYGDPNWRPPLTPNLWEPLGSCP